MAINAFSDPQSCPIALSTLKGARTAVFLEGRGQNLSGLSDGDCVIATENDHCTSLSVFKWTRR
jgi:hypothetical protein